MEEKSSQSVKLSSLKPHFLFNALNSVKCEVISDASDKVDLLDDFAAYLRYILRFSENNNVISAKEIVAFLGSYIRLEEARYDQIRIIFEVETLHFQMEALTLFEIIYNAIHHGLGGNAPDGKVWVRIQKGKGEVIIEILVLCVHKCRKIFTICPSAKLLTDFWHSDRKRKKKKRGLL